MSSLQPVVSVPAYLRAHFRRAIILGLVVGVVALAALTVTGHVLMGLFGCLGVGLGMINARLVQRSVTTYGAATAADKKKTLTASIAGRLALTTMVALVLAFVFAPSGIAVFVGLAVFQVIVMGNTVLALKGSRQS